MQTTIEHKGMELQAATFDGAAVGQRYVTPAGFEVEVVRIDDTHVMLRTNKGKELRTVRTASCYGPIPLVGAPARSDDAPTADDAPVEDAAHEPTPEVPAAEAPVPAAPATPAPKRKRDMTIEELRAEFQRVTGRDTASTDRRYLLYRLSAGGLRRCPPGPVEKRPARDKADLQVIPLGMERQVASKLDAAWKALGFKSRMAFLRDAMVAFLRDEDLAEAKAAADAIEGETA